MPTAWRWPTRPAAAWKDSPRAIGLKQPEGRTRDYTPRRVEIVGKVGSCADENAAVEQDQKSRPGEIVMLLGYCHTSLANYVAPTATRVIDKNPVARLSEADLPPERRPLVDAPAGLPGLAVSQSKAQSMLQALLDRDEDIYVRLSEPDLVEDLDKAGKRLKPEWLRIRLRDIHADYVTAQKIWRPLAGQLLPDARPRTFIERADLPAQGGNSRLIHCWCKQGDCTGKWPVLSLDADNLGTRPYACIATSDYLLGPGRGDRDPGDHAERTGRICRAAGQLSAANRRPPPAAPPLAAAQRRA